MADFITRRLPQSPQQTSSLNSLNDHIQNEANPHPQYLLISDYLGGGSGSIDFSGYVRTSVYNQYTTANDAWKNAHTTDGNPHSQYVLNTTYTPKMAEIDGAIGDLTGTVGDHTTSIGTLQENYNTLNGTVSDHTQTLETYVPIINSHTTDIGTLQTSKLNASTFNTHLTDEYSVLSRDFYDHLTDNESNFHPQYVLKSIYDAKIGELEGLIGSGSGGSGGFTVADLVGRSELTPPTINDTNKPLAGYWGAYLKNLIDTHKSSAYAQNHNGIIPYHLDSSGAELYARRLHSHTPAEIGAATETHNHDTRYLIHEDVNYNRNISYAWTNGNATIYTASSSPEAGDKYYFNRSLSDLGGTITSTNASTSVTIGSTVYTRDTGLDYSLTSLAEQFAAKVHFHSEYNILPLLNQAGIYSKAVTKSAHTEEVPDPNNSSATTTVVVAVDCNTVGSLYDDSANFVNGEYYVVANANNTNFPFNGFEGFIKVSIAEVTPIDYTTDPNTGVITVNIPGVTKVLQRARSISGTEYSRIITITTVRDGTDTTTLANTIEYNGWTIIESESIANIGNSGASYTANRQVAKTHILTLSANCTATISNLKFGETLDLQVTTDGTYTLTFNSVVILDTADNGTFICKFSNKTGTPQLDVILAVLA